MSDIRLTVMEAISRQRTFSARYNDEVVVLAPHLLFERHGDLFAVALNMSKNWRSDEDRRLGQFKLAGLGSPELHDDAFEPLPSYDATAPRADDTIILKL